MWKVGGLKIVTAASRRIILPGWHRNWWKSAFFYKTLRTQKFSTWKFFEGSTLEPIWKSDLHCTPDSTTSETASYPPCMWCEETWGSQEPFFTDSVHKGEGVLPYSINKNPIKNLPQKFLKINICSLLNFGPQTGTMEGTPDSIKICLTPSL